MVAPAVVIAVNRATRRLVRSRETGVLAARSLTASLSRTSVVVAALATAIAMMASVGIMVGVSARPWPCGWTRNCAPICTCGPPALRRQVTTRRSRLRSPEF